MRTRSLKSGRSVTRRELLRSSGVAAAAGLSSTSPADASVVAKSEQRSLGLRIVCGERPIAFHVLN